MSFVTLICPCPHLPPFTPPVCWHHNLPFGYCHCASMQPVSLTSRQRQARLHAEYSGGEHCGQAGNGAGESGQSDRRPSCRAIKASAACSLGWGWLLTATAAASAAAAALNGAPARNWQQTDQAGHQQVQKLLLLSHPRCVGCVLLGKALASGPARLAAHALRGDVSICSIAAGCLHAAPAQAVGNMQQSIRCSGCCTLCGGRPIAACKRSTRYRVQAAAVLRTNL
jgi:hypothetical protein